MRNKVYLTAIAFWGACVGLIAARLLGASGTERAEAIALAGFVIFFGTHLFRKLSEPVTAGQDGRVDK